MLFLIGLGLSEKEIPVGAIEACKNCQELYMDRFTSKITQNMSAAISESTGKRITELSRDEMEENSGTIIKMAASKNVAVLVGGDPLIATTHKILYIGAKEHGVQVGIIHANSIVPTIMGESGLDFYRFGAPCTIPKWSEHYKPTSFYNKIFANMQNSQHSILLLDYDYRNESTLQVPEAVRELEAAESEHARGLIKGSTKILVMGNLSTERSRITATTLAKARNADYPGMNILILPSELTEIEAEAVAARAAGGW